MASRHGSVVLVGARAVLIRGPSGAGKSTLALALIEAARAGRLVFARLVSDDRVHLAAENGRLMARAPPEIAGLMEVRGLGVRNVRHEPMAVVGWVIDLAAPDAARLPEADDQTTVIEGVRLPRLALPRGDEALARVLAFVETGPIDGQGSRA